MKRFTTFASLALALMVAISGFASDLPQYTNGDVTLHSGTGSAAKASRDTFYLIGPWGSPAPVNGQFQVSATDFSPAWNGWYSIDLTQPTESKWHISDFNAANLDDVLGASNLACYCGDPDIPSCGESDPVGGYGNNWNEVIEWRGVVDNNTLNCTVSWTADANYDVEPGYDYLVFWMAVDGGWSAVDYYTGANDLAAPAAVDIAATATPADYQGDNLDEIWLRVQVQSDGGWSDGDCSWPTLWGAAQVDNIVVTLTQDTWTITDSNDFQTSLGNWTPIIPVGVGDFAQLWNNLDDADPCRSNFGAQVAFIDDGLVVPGIGPSVCQDWCYGPGGYIVNTEGGQAGSDAHIHNSIESPIMPWPDPSVEAATLTYEAYRHEDLSANAPGIFYTWGIRSTAGLEEDIYNMTYLDRNLVYYGGPDYIRDAQVVTDLLEPGRNFVQVQLAVYELGHVWGWDGTNGYPAPYFDNVRLIAYPAYGPSMSTREIDIANDGFPEIAEVDLINLGNNWVRFDMANNIAAATHLRNDPGDSIVVDVVPVRAGAELTALPELVWALDANPLFDAYRTSELGTATSGVVSGAEIWREGSAGLVQVPDSYQFDLPDTNFLFPGDVLHYFIRATDAIDGLDPQTTTIPASEQGLTQPDGFGDFSGPLTYSSSFTVRALPSVTETSPGSGEYTQPKTLFWNDFANRGGEAEWHGAFANLGLLVGRDYDVYYTNAPSSGLGNGLGGRASRFSVEGYNNLLYTAGDLGVNTISNGDFDNDAGNDVALLQDWLLQGSSENPRNLFMTGDELVYDMTQNGGSTTNQFVSDWMKVSYVDNDLRPLINTQSTPVVKALAGNGVFLDNEEWVAYGGCLSINTFDAVTVDEAGGGVQLAEFLAPNGASDVYTYSAATMYYDAAVNARVITMPYDFMYIYSNPDAAKANPAALPMRVVVLERVLSQFGIEPIIEDVSGADDTPAVAFSTSVYPNPFNPTTKIQYTMPKAGHLTLKVYNVKGELVKTLIDDSVEAGTNHVMWDGTNQNGAKVSSGVYFSEARTAGQVKVNKMALVK